MLNRRRRASEKHSGFSYEIKLLEASIYYGGNTVGSVVFPGISINPVRKLEMVESIIFVLAEYYDPPFVTPDEPEDEWEGLGEDAFVGDDMDGEEWERMLCQFGVDEDL